MLNVDLDRLILLVQEMFVREVNAKVDFSNVVPWWPYLNSNEAEIIL
jgi:hypothetical protein